MEQLYAWGHLHAPDDDYDLVWMQGGLVESVNLYDQKPLQFKF
jgi:hypothetical protein